jgi:hypothetical protein
MEANNKISAFYQKMPTSAKVGVFIASGVVLFFLYKKIKSKLFPSAEEQRQQQISQSIGGEIIILKRNFTQSYNDSQYGVYANAIYDGMRYCVGDNYDRVKDILKSMNNDLDVALLIQAYGFRQRSCFGIDAGGVDDLFTSVRNELGNSRAKDINNTWARSGIKYRL